MTKVSGAYDKMLFDGNTILLKISEENDKSRYVYIGVDMIYSLLFNHDILKNLSIMGNNLTPYNIATGEENISFSTPHFKFFFLKKQDY